MRIGVGLGAGPLGGLVHLAKSRATIASVLSLLGAQACAATLSLTGGVLQARYIEPDMLGFFATFGILTTYLGVLQGGWLTTLQREYHYLQGKGDSAGASRVLAVSGGWVLLLAVGTSLLFLALVIGNFVTGNVHAAGGWTVQWILVVASLYMLLLGCTYRTASDFRLSSRVGVLSATVSLAMLPGVALWGFWGLCLRAAIPAASNAWAMHRFRLALIRPVLAPRELWALMKFGLPMDAASFLATSAAAATMSAMVAREYGHTALGLFAFARTAEGIVSQMAITVTRVFVPRINQHMGANNDIRACARYAAMPALGGIVLVGAVVLVADIACGPAVRWLTPKYTESIPLIRLLMWAGMYPMLLLPNHVLMAAKRRSAVVGVFASCFVAFILMASLCLYFHLPAIYIAGAYVASKVVSGVVSHTQMWLAASVPTVAAQAG